MVMYKLITILISLVILPKTCVPYRKKSETIQAYHRTGEAVAVDNLIQRYEREHLKFYKEEIRNGDYLKWPDLDNKNISNYCRKYLHQTIPTRSTSEAIGGIFNRILHYKKVKTSTISKVVIVQCNVMNKSFQQTYYITRAPKSKCVYALKSTKTFDCVILTIINKHCNFEEGPLLDRVLKWKREKTVNKIHLTTGQPIARDEYLLKYELEHRELIEREGNMGKCIEWPYALLQPDLKYYCWRYIKECAPFRNRECVTGIWKIETLQYQKLDTNKRGIKVITITCEARGSSTSIRNYHVTKAPERNCVYALLRKGRGPTNPLAIIFKHCNFEDQNGQEIGSRGHGIININYIPKTELKKEPFDTLQPYQFFPD